MLKRHPGLVPTMSSRAWLPPFAAAAAGLVALANLASTLTPDLADRARLLRHLEPVATAPVFHALAVPAAAALGLTAIFLAKRRRRAWQLALALLVALGAFDVLKGLDVEEAALTWGAAGLLWWGRDAFAVAPRRVSLRAGAAFAAGVLAASAALAAAACWVVLDSRPSLGLVLRETGDWLLWRSGPAGIAGGELHLVPLGVELASLAALLSAAWALFRPRLPSSALPDAGARRAALGLVRAHGSDTLAFFKLRGDKQYLFSDDGAAFVGYRVVHGVLLVSGDPVGPPEALPGLVARLVEHVRRHGLALAVVGAGDDTLALWRAAGLRALYLGDEAIVDTRELSLEGRAVRKLRQSVNRLGKAGYTVDLREHSELADAELDELEAVSEAWLDGEPDRGFSMAMDGLRGAHHAGSVVLTARDADGHVRGFLHFVPAHGRPAMSLGYMRREPGTPNGLTEFMVVRAVEQLRERGVEEVSLNFCAFGRWLREPESVWQRLAAGILRPLDGVFQIESLLVFNAKFATRWAPRHVAFEGWASLPRTAVAALEAEGQLPKPALLQRVALTG